MCQVTFTADTNCNSLNVRDTQLQYSSCHMHTQLYVNYKAKRKKERKETQRCDKSHICSDHPRCAIPPPKLTCGVGSRT